MGTAAPSPAEHLRCSRFTDSRWRLACAQPSRERRLLGRLSGRRPLEVSIWMLAPVNWQHDGIDEIVVLGGDFEPNQRLMAYNLADGAERWRVAGLPPCGKSRSVIGGDMVFFAAPDIILDVEAETSPAIDLLERSDTPGQTIWVCLASRANVRRRRPWPLRLTEC